MEIEINEMMNKEENQNEKERNIVCYLEKEKFREVSCVVLRWFGIWYV
jgi:hypothetical protein